jgi:hypothetical protein
MVFRQEKRHSCSCLRIAKAQAKRSRFSVDLNTQFNAEAAF